MMRSTLSAVNPKRGRPRTDDCMFKKLEWIERPLPMTLSFAKIPSAISNGDGMDEVLAKDSQRPTISDMKMLEGRALRCHRL